jgi:hypothetical protein
MEEAMAHKEYGVTDMHNNQEIVEYLGNKWEQMKPETIVRRQIQYLY